MLYLTLAHRLPASPIVDFVLVVLPLLVGVTLASAQPALFLGFLLVSAVLLGKRPTGKAKSLRDENVRRRLIRETDNEAASVDVVDDKSETSRR